MYVPQDRSGTRSGVKLDNSSFSYDYGHMKLAPIQGRDHRDHLRGLMEDGIDIFVLSRGKFRAAVLHGTRLVNQMRANHRLGILETLILGHAYMAAGLMATTLKGNDRLSIGVDCEGPAQGFRVDATASGHVRGYLRNPTIPVDSPPDSFDTAPFIGAGRLTVTRWVENTTRPFTGQIELVHGNLAQDLTRYYAVSEQTPTAVSLSIQFDSEGFVIGAGGLMIQALPESLRNSDLEENSDSSELALENYDRNVIRVEEIVKSLPSLGALFAEGDAGTQIVRRHFAELDPDVIGTRPVEFFCDCSGDRFMRFVAALPADELDDIRRNGPFPLVITCHNCNSEYSFSREEVGSPAKA